MLESKTEYNRETKFEVKGRPRGKGRPRFGGGHAYTPESTREYEEEIALEYRAAGGKLHGGYIEIGLKAFYKIPKTAAKEKAELMRRGLLRPAVKPDIDNVLKAVMDGLNGAAYSDDAQVIAGSFEKLYGDEPKILVTVGEI